MSLSHLCLMEHQIGFLDLLTYEQEHQPLFLENGNDISSSFSFPSSSLSSNGSSEHNIPPPNVLHEAGTNLELLRLRRLSSSLEKLVIDPEYDYSDAEIEIEGISVAINRCILAVRSPFFHELFKKDDKKYSTKEGKPKYEMSKLVGHGRIGYEAFMFVLNYLYSGTVKNSPPEVSTCVDESCPHDACGPAIHYAVELMYGSAKFQITELVMLVQRHLHNFVDKAYVEDVIPILMVAFHCNLDQLLSHCVQRIACSDLDDIILEKELPYEVLTKVRSVRSLSKEEEEQDSVSSNEKRIKKIHRALDSNDVELLELLLKESNISLDIAHALHYAAAFCNPKTVAEVLNLGNADINLKNSRGYTVLHVAARRKDLSIVVRLLKKGASVYETTRDGQSAVNISRRLTRPKDYDEAMKHGQETNKDRLCIDVLEREMITNPLVGSMSMSSMTAPDDLVNGLLLLENRVAFARSFFPQEARLAMDIAHAGATSEFNGLSAAKGSFGNLREVDLNELPSEQVKRLQDRLQALEKTVETGRRFFPNCSEFLDKLVEDESLGPHMLEKGSPEEQIKKKQRYMELKKDVEEAFTKDKAINDLADLSPSSSPRACTPKANKVHKRRKRYT